MLNKADPIQKKVEAVNPAELDLRVVFPKTIPSYLRIDKDIQEALLTVARLSNEYANFNIEKLEWQMQRKLELQLDQQSNAYKQHKKEVAQQIERVK